MKNRLGNPTFLVRLEPEQEKVLIGLSKKFGKDSYPKTIIEVAMCYENEVNELKRSCIGLHKEVKTLKDQLKASEKRNEAMSSKMSAFVKLVDKIADIKPQLRIFRKLPAAAKK